jgi:hypothetical protein
MADGLPEGFSIDAPAQDTAGLPHGFTVDTPATLGQTALDVAKQIPAGIVSGVEAIPSAVPSALGAIGHGVEWAQQKLGLQSPEAAEQIRQREALKQQVQSAYRPISSLLPQPTTTAGQYARTGAEFLPAAAAGPGSLTQRVIGQDIVPAVASETAGQLTKGTEAEPYARTASAVLGGFPFGRWRSGTTPAPLVDDLHGAATAAYDKIRQSGFALKPQHVANIADQIEQDLTRRGWTERNVPETYGVIRDLQALKNAPQGATVPADHFDMARQELLQATRNQTNKREGGAGWTAIGKLDDYLANVPQSHVANGNAAATSALFDEARSNWAAMKRLEMAQGKVELGALNAETSHSGMNVDNALRQSVKQLIRPNKFGKTLAEQHGFDDNEIGLMNDIARGSATKNTIRYVGNLLGGGGGFGQLGLTAAGLGLGYETGDASYLALPAMGAAARYGAGKISQAEAQRLLQQVARRSTLGRQTAQTIPSQLPELTSAGLLRGAAADQGQKRGGALQRALKTSARYR